MTKDSIIIHSGAGGGKFGPRDRRFRELGNALMEGISAMKRGSSLDGVEAAVFYMEETGAYNAGRGSVLTAFGEVEMDAAVMSGRRNAGAVGACTCTYHPVSLARAIMEKTNHVLVAGQYCEAYLRMAGMMKEVPLPSPEARKWYKEAKKRVSERSKTGRAIASMDVGGTVGAVAIDRDGLPSAAVSTGGLSMKLPGRVGDSAIIGAGVYADSKLGAACATGIGEEIIKSALSWNACQYLAGADAKTAAERAVGLIGRLSGKGVAGIITVDLKGRVGFSYNTLAMGRAWFDEAKGRPVIEF